MIESHDSLAAWIASRPESVRALAAKYPMGMRYLVDGVPHHLLGYTEDGKLILSALDPTADYETSYAARVYICASHFDEETRQ